VVNTAVKKGFTGACGALQKKKIICKSISIAVVIAVKQADWLEFS